MFINFQEKSPWTIRCHLISFNRTVRKIWRLRTKIRTGRTKIRNARTEIRSERTSLNNGFHYDAVNGRRGWYVKPPDEKGAS